MHTRSIRGPRMVLALAAALGVSMALSMIVPARSAAAQGTKERGASGYHGVVPGGQAEGKPAKRLPSKRITWVGFQPQGDGTARLFVQLTSEAAYSQSLQDGVLTVQIEGARLRAPNSGRRLDMRFFDTALAQVSTRRVAKRKARGDRSAQSAGVALRIEFKNAADAREARAELRAEADGYHYLYLDFGAPGVRISE